eukprot:3466313-Alexandrium_andersonii.AAC.1
MEGLADPLAHTPLEARARTNRCENRDALAGRQGAPNSLGEVNGGLDDLAVLLFEQLGVSDPLVLASRDLHVVRKADWDGGGARVTRHVDPR